MTPEVQRIVDAHVRAERRRIARQMRDAARLPRMTPWGPVYAMGYEAALTTAADELDRLADPKGVA